MNNSQLINTGVTANAKAPREINSDKIYGSWRFSFPRLFLGVFEVFGMVLVFSLCLVKGDE